MPRKHALCVVSSALVLGSLAACGDSDGGDDSSNHTVPIAVIASMSGQYGVSGEPFRDGAEYAVKQINDAGGFTVDGVEYKFDLHSVDDRGDPATSVQLATGLIQDDKVRAIIGPIALNAPPVAQLTNQRKVIDFSSSSAVAATAGPDNPYTFITLPPLSLRVDASVASIQTFAPDAQSVAILAPNDQTGQVLTPALEDGLKSAGYDVKTFPFEPGTTDLSSVVGAVARQDPDLIVMGWSLADKQAETAQFDAAGISSDATLFFYGDSAGTCKDLAGGRPCIANPLTGTDLGAESPTPAAKEFTDGYLAFSKQSELPQSWVSVEWSYDWPFMLASAMTKAGTTTDTDKIAAALREVSREGLVGNIAFNEKNSAVFGLDISLVEPDGSMTTEHFGE